MSSAFVRRAIYTALPTVLPGFEFVPTLNVETHPELLPQPQWYTVDFEPLEEIRPSLGQSCFQENGVVIVTLAQMANDAEGDLNLADMAETVRGAFLDWVDPSGELRINQIDPPIEVDGGDLHGAWWLMEVPMTYAYHRHGAITSRARGLRDVKR